MTPADPSAAVGVHAPDELVAALRVALAQVMTPESISVPAEMAAKLVGVCSKTLASFPPEQTGRVKLARRTVYELSTLRRFVKDRVGKSIESN